MISVLFAIFESWWRRCFGNDGWNIPILKERGVEHILNAIVVGAYLLCIKGIPWQGVAWCVAVIQILFYSRTFFAGFDMGHSYPPSEDEIKAYGVIGKILNKFFRVNRYMFWYDFCFMTIRYTYPLILLLPFFKLPLLFVGVGVAVGYATGWKYKPFGMTTEFGEFVMGFLLAVGVILC